MNYYKGSFTGKSFDRKKIKNLGTLTFPEGLAYPYRVTFRQRKKKATNFHHNKPEILQLTTSLCWVLTLKYWRSLGNKALQKSTKFVVIAKVFQANVFFIRV